MEKIKHLILYTSSGTSVISWIIAAFTLSNIAAIVGIIAGIVAIITGRSTHKKNKAITQKVQLEAKEIEMRIQQMQNISKN